MNESIRTSLHSSRQLNYCMRARVYAVIGVPAKLKRKIL